MTNDFSALYAQFMEIMNKGTEKEARTFLMEHMNELPEDLREKVVLTLFADGLKEAATNHAAVEEFQKEGIEIMQELETGKRILDDKLKVLELQEKMR